MSRPSSLWTNVLAATCAGLLVCCSAAGPDAEAPPEAAPRSGAVAPPPAAPASPLPSELNLPGSSGDGTSPPTTPSPTTAPATGRAIWATAGKKLLKFTSDAPSKVEVRDVTGMGQAEQMVGLAFRKNGTLYTVGTTSRLFALAPTTATATAISFAPFAALLDGTAFGFDFDPISDLARVTSNTTANIRVEAETGTVTNVDGAVAYVAGDKNAGAVPRASAVAYAADGTGYAIDTKTGTLARILDSYSGQIQTIGGMGAAFTDVAGFDIAGKDAFAALRVGTTTSLYTVDLATGKITSLGKIGDGGPLTGIAIQP